MKIHCEETHEQLAAHVEATHANFGLGGYKMDQVAPTAEFVIYRAELEEVDMGRLFLLGQFATMTLDSTGLVRDARETLIPAETLERIELGRSRGADARLEQHSLVAVTPGIDVGMLTLIDGNHRALRHWLDDGTLAGVQILVAVHPGIVRWGMLPSMAKRTI